MSDSRPLTFKSVDAKKENPQNKPGNFTVKFTPELFLEENKTHLMALDHLSMTASWHNIRPEYENNKLVISKDGGNTWETISFPAGIFDYRDINEFIHKAIGKTGDDFGISVLFDLTTYKVFIQLANGFQVDFTQSGNFNVLLGFEKKIVSSSEYGANFPNITNSVDNLYLKCNLLSDSIVFFIPLEPRQRQDLCSLKFNPIIICGVKLTQKQSRKCLFGSWMMKTAK